MANLKSRCGVAMLLLALCACGGVASTGATQSPGAEPPPAANQFYLLGEVHDNPDSHRQRFAWLQARVKAGWRGALVMEQFDRESQPRLSAAQATCTDADCVIRMAGGKRWDWPHYRPLIDLALRYRLPLLAANVSRSDAGRVMQQGLPAALDAATIRRFHLDQAIPAALQAALQQQMQDGHCGKLPTAMMPGMVKAQLARDVWMAKTLLDKASQGAVLIAGNGHVRRDLGVPRWLQGLPSGSRVEVHGYLEPDDNAPSAAFDVRHALTRFARPDPCQTIPDAQGNRLPPAPLQSFQQSNLR